MFIGNPFIKLHINIWWFITVIWLIRVYNPIWGTYIHIFYIYCPQKPTWQRESVIVVADGGDCRVRIGVHGAQHSFIDGLHSIRQRRPRKLYIWGAQNPTHKKGLGPKATPKTHKSLNTKQLPTRSAKVDNNNHTQTTSLARVSRRSHSVWVQLIYWVGAVCVRGPNAIAPRFGAFTNRDAVSGRY